MITAFCPPDNRTDTFVMNKRNHRWWFPERQQMRVLRGIVYKIKSRGSRKGLHLVSFPKYYNFFQCECMWLWEVHRTQFVTAALSQHFLLPGNICSSYILPCIGRYKWRFQISKKPFVDNSTCVDNCCGMWFHHWNLQIHQSLTAFEISSMKWNVL